LGGLEAMLGNFPAARELVGQAGQRYEQLGLDADTYLRLSAAVEMFAGFPDLAEVALRTSCTALQHNEHIPVLATRAAELADAIYEQGRYDEAKTWIRLARESAGSDDVDAAFVSTYVHAKVLARLGAVDEAERSVREALNLVARTDALNRQGDSRLALAEILRLQGRENEADEQIRAALRLYTEKGNVVSAERAKVMLLQRAVPE
jgi:tetratricopeptide (TPR) repeat protein